MKMKAVSLVEVKVVVMARMMDCLSALRSVYKMDQMTVAMMDYLSAVG